MSIADKLRQLSKNLYWAWHPECVRIFRDLHTDLWREVNHNPVEFLDRLADEVVQKRDGDSEFTNHLDQALQKLHTYLGAVESWGAWHGGPLNARPVAYFSAEFGLHESLPIYSGGLGVLAGDHLKAASDLGIPMVGVGLAYTHGYFDQSLDSHGWQQEHYAYSGEIPSPLERVLNDRGEPVKITVRVEFYEIWVGIWQVRVGRNLLLLLDTDVEGNSQNDRTLTSRLYGSNGTIRLLQEVILGIGGMHALRELGIFPAVIHLNEGHSAFAVLELTRHLMAENALSFKAAAEDAATRTVFTTHTAVGAGHDTFDPSVVERTLSVFRRELGLDKKTFWGLGRIHPENESEPFSMTVLALKMSRSRNAVSFLHARVTRVAWQGLWPQYRLSDIPIQYVTNGVHVDTWLCTPMADLYSQYLGAAWRDEMDRPQTWQAIQAIPDEVLWGIDQTRRAHLIHFINRSLIHQQNRRHETEPEIIPLNPQALTIGSARRFTAYKRMDLLFRDPERLARLVNQPARPVQFVFAGKSHPLDQAGKEIIQSVFQWTRDPRFNGRIVFLENYNINTARHLVQGADAWLNTPRRPLEASGTSGQKAAMNGVLNISILDGWWAQAYDGANGFAIGAGSEHGHTTHQDHLDAQTLFDVLEKQVVPQFYERDAQGIPRAWISRQKHALRTLTWRYSARRMLIDYTLGCYLPAVGGLTSSLQVDTRLLTDGFEIPQHLLQSQLSRRVG